MEALKSLKFQSLSLKMNFELETETQLFNQQKIVFIQSFGSQECSNLALKGCDQANLLKFQQIDLKDVPDSIFFNVLRTFFQLFYYPPIW